MPSRDRRWSGWPSPELEQFHLRERPILALRARGAITKDECLIRLSLLAEELQVHDQVDWSPWEDGGYVLPWKRRAPAMQPQEVTGR